MRAQRAFPFLLLLFCTKLLSQTVSVQELSRMPETDTAKTWAYLELANQYYASHEYDSGYYYAARGYLLARKQDFVPGMHKNLNTAGLCLTGNGKHDEAIAVFKVAHAYTIAARNRKSEARVLNGLGICETRKGNYGQAIDYYLSALKIEEELNTNRQNIANLYNNIGVIYKRSGNFEQARRYARIALHMRMALKDSAGIAVSYNNLSNTFSYNTKADSDSVLYFLERSLVLRRQLRDSAGIAQCWTNIGNYYLNWEAPEKALVFYLKAYDLNKKLGLVTEILYCENNLAETYYDLKRFEEAKKYGEAALQTTLAHGLADDESSSRKKLAKIYLAMKDYKKAAESFDRYVEIRDTFFSQTVEDRLAEARYNFEFEKKADKMKQEQALKDAVSAQEKRTQKIIILAVSFGLLLVLIVLVQVFRGYQQKKKANVLISQQKKEVEEQKHLVEEKQKEIIDSILYARRIQRSLLTKEKYIHKVMARLRH
jgi:tetratricopeptide (TPR) repeat protein